MRTSLSGGYNLRVLKDDSLQLSDVPQSSLPSSLGNWLHTHQIDRFVVFKVPLTTRFRSVESREGILLHGAYGWGEVSPFLEYEPAEAAQWWLSGVEQATKPALTPVRASVPVNVTIPVSSPEEAAARAAGADCKTAKIKVADPRSTPQEDAARIDAVSNVLAGRFGNEARVRIDVNGSWGPDEACGLLEIMNRAAAAVGGLEYVEQPCMSVEDMAFVRARTEVPVAADESIRRAKDPFKIVEMGAADIAVVKVAPLGGVRRALTIAEQLPLPIVVSSALDTSIGLASGVRLAAALPELDYACGLDTARLNRADVVARTVTSKRGQIPAQLGRLVPEQALLESGAPVGEETVDHWVRRAEDMVGALGDAN